MHAYIIQLHQGVYIYVAEALFLSDNTHKLSTTNFRTLYCVALYFVCLLQFQFGHGSSLVKFICFMLKPISISTSIEPCGNVPWWSHQVEIFSALLAICVGNSPVTGDLPAQRRVTRRFGVFFYLRLNKRFIKQSWGWWFEMALCSLWRHCNVILMALNI